MKRIKSIILVALVLFSLLGCAKAEQEFTFKNIPWGTSIDGVKKKITKYGKWVVDSENAIVPHWSDMGKKQKRPGNGGMMGWLTRNPEKKEIKIEGYSVSRVEFYFTYGLKGKKVYEDRKSSQLCRAECYLVAKSKLEAYQDLVSRLTKKYGKGKETIYKETGAYASGTWVVHTTADLNRVMKKYTLTTRITVWKGENSTAIRVKCKTYNVSGYGENTISIDYGKTNYDKTLTKIEKIRSNNQ